MTSYAMQESAERRAERLAAERGTVRCALCPWQATGSMLRAMERAREHRRRAHPEAPVESTARWRNEPPRSREEPKRQARQAVARPEGTSLRERAVALLRERGESTAAALGAELGATAASVSSALGWAEREGLVESRGRAGAKEKLWRAAGTAPAPEPEPAAGPPTVEDVLRAAAGPVTIEDVVTATGRPRGSVSTTLAGLVRRGRAERAGRGLYRIV